MNRINLYGRCKYGWNWHFVFGETEQGGNAVTIIKKELLWRTRWSLDTVVSGYPGGCREDSVAESIDEAIVDLKAEANDCGVAINEINGRNFDSLVIGAAEESEIVRRFARSLSRIRRVIVDVTSERNDENEKYGLC